MYDNYPQRQEVTVTDIKMSFGSMVWFMVKWAFASIPALIIVFGVIIAVNIIILMILGALGVGLGAVGKALGQ